MKRSTIILLAVLTIAVSLTIARTRATSIALEEPVVTKAVAPARYPAIAIQAHVSGKVVVEVEVDATGHVISSHAKSGHPLLQLAATQAAKLWEFAPASDRVKGKVAHITFDFETVAKLEDAEIYFRAPNEFHYAIYPCQLVQATNNSH